MQVRTRNSVASETFPACATDRALNRQLPSAGPAAGIRPLIPPTKIKEGFHHKEASL